MRKIFGINLKWKEGKKLLNLCTLTELQQTSIHNKCVFNFCFCFILIIRGLNEWAFVLVDSTLTAIIPKWRKYLMDKEWRMYTIMHQNLHTMFRKKKIRLFMKLLKIFDSQLNWETFICCIYTHSHFGVDGCWFAFSHLRCKTKHNCVHCIFTHREREVDGAEESE